MHGNTAELREGVAQLVPDPNRYMLAGRRVEALDVVQVPVIERVVNRLECSGNLIEIDDPSVLLVELPLYEHLDSPRVAMQARALAALGCSMQLMGRLEGEGGGKLEPRRFRLL